MAQKRVEYLLIGGGFASGHCAAELRKGGADGEILLVGREPEVPYERPPLSKEYMRGESSVEDAYVHDEDWYADNDVELLAFAGFAVVMANATPRVLPLGDLVAQVFAIGDARLDDAQADRQRRELLADIVVEVARDLGALGFLREDEAMGQ